MGTALEHTECERDFTVIKLSGVRETSYPQINVSLRIRCGRMNHEHVVFGSDSTYMNYSIVLTSLTSLVVVGESRTNLA